MLNSRISSIRDFSGAVATNAEFFIANHFFTGDKIELKCSLETAKAIIAFQERETVLVAYNVSLKQVVSQAFLKGFTIEPGEENGRVFFKASKKS